jgi:hypothetical protein
LRPLLSTPIRVRVSLLEARIRGRRGAVARNEMAEIVIFRN